MRQEVPMLNNLMTSDNYIDQIFTTHLEMNSIS